MAKSVPSRAKKGWSKYESGSLIVMVNEGGGDEEALEMPPDARFARWEDGRTLVVGPTGERLVMIASLRAGNGGVKLIFSEPTAGCRRDGCVLHTIARGRKDRHVCIGAEEIGNTSLEEAARAFVELGLEVAAAAGEPFDEVEYATPADVVKQIDASGAAKDNPRLDTGLKRAWA